MATNLDVIVNADGSLRFIHNDDMQAVIEQGEARIARASFVEPNASGQWEADMSPSNGPVLGPFRTRTEALAAEVAWLKTNRGL